MYSNFRIKLNMDLTKETHAVSYYGTLTIGTFGILANFLNIKVCHTSEFIQDTTMGFFNIRLSLSNLMSITMIGLSLFPQSFGSKYDLPLVLTSNLACKTIPYFTRVFTQITPWLMVMNIHDRLYTLNLYNNVNYNPTVENPSLTISEYKLEKRVRALIIGVLIVNMPNLFFTLDYQANSCTADYGVVILRDIISYCSHGVLPFCLQIYFTIRLANEIRIQNQRIRGNLDFARQRKHSFKLVVFNLIYIGCELNDALFIVLSSSYGYNSATYIATESSGAAVSAFLHVCSTYLSMFVLYDCLFIVNVITNRIFRQEAIRIFIY